MDRDTASDDSMHVSPGFLVEEHKSCLSDDAAETLTKDESQTAHVRQPPTISLTPHH